FKIPAFTPVLYNLSSIACSLFLRPFLETPIYALAIGVFIGGVLQLGAQVPALVRVGMLPRISWNVFGCWQDPGVRRIMRNMLPAILAVSAT
ncbi:lipid II flippase MurJ, partial [Acinetobacter baumannii]